MWFICIAALGLVGIVREPGVLAAVNPWYAVDFFIRDGLQGFLILGAVVLVLTGARRCTRTWGISVAGRSGWPGSAWCCPR